MFLITGCGRSGTLYMAKALRLAGFAVGHEELGPAGAVSSQWAVDTEHYPYYHQQGPRPVFDIVLHQVREPLATIGSLTTSLPQSWRFVGEFVPVTGDVVLDAAAYWYHWNLLAESQAVFTYRIEALERAWPRIMAVLGGDAPYEVVRGLPKNVNARDHVAVQWKGLGAYRDKIEGLSRRYGYRWGE